MKRFQLTTCSVNGCNRTARHWVRFCASRPQRRQPVCHRCFKSVQGQAVAIAVDMIAPHVADRVSANIIDNVTTAHFGASHP